MRYLLITIILLLTPLVAKEKQTLTIGLGAYTQSQPYTDVANILTPSPVIFYDNSVFYIRWSRAGVYFLGNKSEDISWGFSLTAQPRPFGYKASDSEALEGMDERKQTIEGGVAFSASYHKKQYIEMMLLTDVLDNHNSWLLKTEIGDKYTLGKATFYPSIVIMYQSQNFLDYYYGVKNSEATPTRNPYTPSAGWEFGAQTYIHYPLYKNYALLLNLRGDVLPKTAQNSPIVAKDYIYSGLFSVIYKFQY